MKKLLEFFQQDDGTFSMLRLLVACVLVVFTYLMYLFTRLLYFELNSEEINYSGLSLLFTTMFINFILAILLKVIQKKYENRAKNSSNN